MPPVTSKVLLSSIQLYNDSPAEMCYVTIKGSELSEKLLHPELVRPHLNTQEIDATVYEEAFSQLTEDEKKAVRHWTNIMLGRGYYSDGTSVLQNEISVPGSYTLNRKLYEKRLLNKLESEFVRNLNSAINKLPHTTGDFIRISEYSTDPNDNPWINGTINVGDIVTNTPAFMSASDYWAYVDDTLVGFNTLENTTAYILYEFVNSNQFVPLLRGVASLCVEENEHLAPVGSAFRVLGITYAKPENNQSELKVRIGVLLEDCSEKTNAKNIHSGEIIS